MVGRICPPPGWNRVKVSENLGATAVAPVAPVDTSLQYLNQGGQIMPTRIFRPSNGPGMAFGIKMLKSPIFLSAFSTKIYKYSSIQIRSRAS